MTNEFDSDRYYVRKDLCGLNMAHINSSLVDCKEAIKELTNYAKETNMSISGLKFVIENHIKEIDSIKKKQDNTVKILMEEKEKNVKQDMKIYMVAMAAGLTGSGIMQLFMGGIF